MNKYTELLEKHVQWIALAIGGLWLLYMVYTFVIVADSSSIQVGGQTVGAGSVDKFVNESKAKPLREKMDRTEKLTDVVGQYAREVSNQLHIESSEAPQFATNWVRTPAGVGAEGTTTGTDPNRVLVKDLPHPPVPGNPDSAVGRSIVLMLPQGAAAGAAGVPQMVSWVTVAATIPMADLGKEFNRCLEASKLVAALHQTVVLRVELVREELLPNGQWGKQVTIASQDLGQNQAANAAAPMTFPPENNKQLQIQYAVWAAGAQKTITQPSFYATVPNRGDPWHLPGQEVAPPPGANNQPPAVAPPPTPTPVTPPPPRPTTPRPPIRGSQKPSGRGDASQALPPGVVAVAQVFDQPPPGATPGSGTMMGGGAAAPAAVIPPANKPGEPPATAFDPEHANDIQIYVHDATVEPGKTYRYQIRYSIKSPVFNANTACSPSTLGDTFELKSPLSQPTKAVTVPNTTFFFIVAAPGLGDNIRNVKLEVFKWDVDGLKKSTVEAVPGDEIDPKLKVTLVDIRDRGADVIFMDENGALFSRNVQEDSRSPDLKKAQQESDKAIAPLAGG